MNILNLALKDSDVRDVAGRLATVETKLPGAVALCSPTVARSVNDAAKQIGDAVDAAMAGSTGGWCVHGSSTTEHRRL